MIWKGKLEGQKKSLARLHGAKGWQLKDKSKKPPKWDPKKRAHREVFGNCPPLGKKLPLHSCRLDGSPAKNLVVGLEPLHEDKLDEEWKREWLEPSRYPCLCPWP